MPVNQGRDKRGSYYRWGSQKKYYYITGNTKSRNAAKAKAAKQGRAIELSKLMK